MDSIDFVVDKLALTLVSLRAFSMIIVVLPPGYHIQSFTLTDIGPIICGSSHRHKAHYMRQFTQT